MVSSVQSKSREFQLDFLLCCLVSAWQVIQLVLHHSCILPFRSSPPLINRQLCAVVYYGKGKVTLLDPHPKAVLSCPCKLYQTLQSRMSYCIQLNVYFEFGCQLAPSVNTCLCVSVDPPPPAAAHFPPNPAPAPHLTIKQRKKHGYNYSGDVRTTYNSNCTC